MSTLFPYTRSSDLPQILDISALDFDVERIGRERQDTIHSPGGSRPVAQAEVSLRGVIEDNGIARIECFRDRKSTRLNSSHQIISYAVFCLKKKNPYISYTCGGGRTCTTTDAMPNAPMQRG